MKTAPIALPAETVLQLAALAKESLRANGKTTLPHCVAIELMCALPTAPVNPITEADLTELELLNLRYQQVEGRPCTPADIKGKPVDLMLEVAYRFGQRRRAQRQANCAAQTVSTPPATPAPTQTPHQHLEVLARLTECLSQLCGNLLAAHPCLAARDCPSAQSAPPASRDTPQGAAPERSGRS